MARPKRIQYEGAVYHITIRGNARSALFFDDLDRHRFLRILEESVCSFDIHLYLFCLMTNHVHMVLETPGANLSQFMHRLQTAYTVYFNRRHRRVGHLMQGRYGSRLVDREGYMLQLSRYVHLNPVFVSSVKRKPLPERISLLRGYRWSSYRSYIGRSKRFGFVDYSEVLSSMNVGRSKASSEYRRFVESGISEIDSGFIATAKQSPLCIGSDDFRDRIHDLYSQLFLKKNRQEDVSFRGIGGTISAEKIVSVFTKVLGINDELLFQRQRDSLVRPMAAMLLCKHGGLSQREVAELLHLGSGAAVSLQLKRLREAIPGDKKLKRQMDKIERLLIKER
jgi:putative transposase